MSWLPVGHAYMNAQESLGGLPECLGVFPEGSVVRRKRRIAHAGNAAGGAEKAVAICVLSDVIYK